MGLDEGLCFLWSLLPMEEPDVNARRNRLRRAVLKVRARIAHAMDQKKIAPDAPEALSRRLEVGVSGHMIMRRDFFRALESKKITREEYMQALMIIGRSPAEFNARELAEKIAMTEMASGLREDRDLGA